MAASAHPYDLSTLNGVTFSGDGVSLSSTEYLPNLGTSGVEFSTSQPGQSTVNVEYIDSNQAGSTPTVASTSNFYVAGSVGPNGYYLPTFGSITFSAPVGAYTTLYVHGFESNGPGSGLLVSSVESVALLNKSSPDGIGGSTIQYEAAITPTGGGPGLYQLTNLGIITNFDLGGGPTSPVYYPVSGYYYYDLQGEAHYHASGFAFAPDGNANPPISHANGTTIFPLTFTNDGSAYTPPCFVEGTRLATARGEIAVEALAVGDEVQVASGGTRPVIWIGSRRVRPDRHRHPDELHPVRVRRGAFGDGAPARDLWMSPGHAVFVDGVLVPVGLLVNGATIVQEPVDSVRYVHVELDAHDVLLAEGLACESYLEDDNRDTFANADEHTALHGRLDPVSWEGACAPVLRDRAADGSALAAIQARLHARAEALGWARADAPEVEVWLDGAALAPVHSAAGRVWVCAPGDAALRLSSRAARPADVIPGHLDTRRLGVAVAEVCVDGQALDLASAAFEAGFLPLERSGETAWRWTDGEAWLVLDGAHDATVLVEVAMNAAIPAWIAPAPRLRLVQVG